MASSSSDTAAEEPPTLGEFIQLSEKQQLEAISKALKASKRAETEHTSTVHDERNAPTSKNHPENAGRAKHWMPDKSNNVEEKASVTTKKKWDGYKLLVKGYLKSLDVSMKTKVIEVDNVLQLEGVNYLRKEKWRSCDYIRYSGAAMADDVASLENIRKTRFNKHCKMKEKAK